MLNNYHTDTPINFVLFDSPGYKSLLIFVRNQAQALMTRRRTFFSLIVSIISNKKTGSSDQRFLAI
jgi:hypothetical protein